jgi:hypothetical protein
MRFWRDGGYPKSSHPRGPKPSLTIPHSLSPRPPPPTHTLLMTSLHPLQVLAKALMTWAMERGATNFSHTFYPMRGVAAGTKLDAFLSLDFGSDDVSGWYTGLVFVRVLCRVSLFVRKLPPFRSCSTCGARVPSFVGGSHR